MSAFFGASSFYSFFHECTAIARLGTTAAVTIRLSDQAGDTHART
jgi:hypothetical protein